MDETRSGWAPRLISAVLLLAFLGGFVNQLGGGGIAPATLLIDGLVALMFVHLILEACYTRCHMSAPIWAVLVFVTALCYLGLFVASPEPLGAKSIAFRNHIGYAVVAVYAFTFVRRQVDVDQLVTLAMRLAVAIALFGIVQAQFPERLPPQFLAPVGEEAFGYYNTDIVRSNGLVGNTIVFATLLMLFYGLHLARWASKPNLWSGVATAVMLVAIMTTYSRVAIVGAAGIGLATVALILWRRNAAAFLTFGVFGGFMTLFVGWLLWPKIHGRVESTFIWRGLFGGTNASVRGSDAGHEEDIRIGRELFSENPLTGVGIGTQAQGSTFGSRGGHVITDGAIWARLAEGGLFLAIPYVALLLAVFVLAAKAWRAEHSNWVAAGLLGFMTYEFTIAVTYNSAFFGKSVFLTFWMIVGLVAAQRRIASTAATPIVEPHLEPEPVLSPGRPNAIQMVRR